MAEIDMDALLDQVVDAAIDKFLSTLLQENPDEKENFKRMLYAFSSRGIPVITAIEILSDLAKISDEKENNK